MNALRSIGWLASSVLVALALCLHHRYYLPDAPGRELVLALAALPLLAFAWPSAPALGRRAALVVAVAAAAATAFEPLRPGAAFLAAGAALAWPARRAAWRDRLSWSSAAIGVLWLIGCGIVPLWVRVEILQPSFDRLESALALLVRSVGGQARALDGVLRLGTESGTVGLDVDLYKLGGLFCVLVSILDATLVALAAGPRAALERWLRGAALLIVFAPVRLLVLALAHTLFVPLDVLLDPAVLVASFAPPLLAWALSGPHPAGRASEGLAATFEPRSGRRGLATCAAGLALVAVASGFHDGGTPREGRVLLDESHSEWEDSEVPFDREHWGRASTYNYAELADLLRRHFDFEVHREGSLTAETLAGVQVLILKTPTKPYDSDEAQAILDFVERGGGLWLVGDHTNLHGMSDVLNVLAARAGMRFRNDALYDMRTGWTTANDDSTDLHPASLGTRGLAYQTSCSISIEDLGVEPALVGWRLTGEMADYGNPNFFGNMVTELEDRTGLLLQSAAGSIGRGRVALFSDSTILSNFALFDRGVSELALRTVEYLRREERMPKGWREALAVLGLVLLARGGAALAASGSAAVIGAAAWLAVGVAAADAGLARLARASYAIPRIEDPYRVVAFVEDASTFELSTFVEEAMAKSPDPHEHKGRDDTKSRSISTFFTWVLRLDGARPRLDASLAEAVSAGADVLVLFEPVRSPLHEEMVALQRFVLGGGRLLVLDELRNHGASTASQWLRPFGLSFETVSGDEELQAVQPDVDWEITRTLACLAGVDFVANAARAERFRPAGRMATIGSESSLVVAGGQPFLFDSDARSVGSHARFGRGLAVAIGRSTAFTNAALGGRFDPKPDATGLARQLGVLDILESVLELGRDEPARVE